MHSEQPSAFSLQKKRREKRIFHFSIYWVREDKKKGGRGEGGRGEAKRVLCLSVTLSHASLPSSLPSSSHTPFPLVYLEDSKGEEGGSIYYRKITRGEGGGKESGKGGRRDVGGRKEESGEKEVEDIPSPTHKSCSSFANSCLRS